MRIGNFNDSDTFTSLFAMLAAFGETLRGEFGLTVEQFRILCHLSKGDRDYRVGQLSGLLGAPKSGVSASLRQLESRGLISRGEGHQSGFRVLDEGVRVLVRAKMAVERTIDGCLDRLPRRARRTSDIYLITMAIQSNVRVFSDGEFDIAFAYVEICSKTKRLLSESARAFGLTVGEYRILNELSDREGGSSPCELTKLLSMSKSRVTTHCESLARKGLAAKHEDPHDARAVRVLATDAGRELFDRARGTYQSSFIRAIRPIESGEEEYYLALNRAIREGDRRARPSGEGIGT